MPAERALQLVAALLPLFTPLPWGALADPVTADIGCGDTAAAAVRAGGSAHWYTSERKNGKTLSRAKARWTTYL